MNRSNLIDLRRSDRLAIAQSLVSIDAFADVAQAIEKTLLRFSRVTSENEEQIYLFGATMRQLLAERANKSLSFPPFRSHIDEGVQTVFAGGFVGLTLADTLQARQAMKLNNSSNINRTEIVNLDALEVSILPAMGTN